MLSVFLIAIRVDMMTSCIRANKNAADTFNNVQASPDGLPPYSAEGQHKTHQDSVKRSDRKQTYQTYLPTAIADKKWRPLTRAKGTRKGERPTTECRRGSSTANKSEDSSGCKENRNPVVIQYTAPRPSRLDVQLWFQCGDHEFRGLFLV